MGRLKKFIKFDFWIVLLDIVAVNAAYYLALFIRFFQHHLPSSNFGFYLRYFARFAPYYTVICLLIFFVCRLYGGLWTFAGLNDMNRIIEANIITSAIQVVGTLLFVKRMPITYYVIGGFLQLLFIIFIRFSYKFILMEIQKINRKKVDTIPAMVIGSGAYGKKVILHLEQHTPFSVTVIAGKDSGHFLNGIPVVDIRDVAKQISRRKIQAVFIADDSLSKDQLDSIRDAADGLMEFRNYTGVFNNLTGPIPLSGILDIMEGPVTIEFDGKEQHFDSPHEAFSMFTEQYEVQSITAQRIKLRKPVMDESWIRSYQEQTGEEVSFF